ncbi:MAG: hypothetical protein ACM3SQ_01710 [Betaproteobacteria bacterium]
MKHFLVAASAMLLLHPTCAGAQDDLARVKRSIGDRVDITEADGIVISGVLRDVTTGTLALDGHEVALDSVLKIDRHGDPIWDGMLIGAGVGLALSPISAEGCLDGSRIPCVLGPMVLYGGIGALWDSLHVGRKTIYRRAPTSPVRIAFVPMVSPHARSIGLRWSF